MSEKAIIAAEKPFYTAARLLCGGVAQMLRGIAMFAQAATVALTEKMCAVHSLTMWRDRIENEKGGDENE